MSIFSSLANYQQITGKLNLFTIIADYQCVSEMQFRFWHVSASYQQITGKLNYAQKITGTGSRDLSPSYILFILYQITKKNQTAKEFIQKLFFINNCFELIATKWIPYAFYLIFESLPFIR